MVVFRVLYYQDSRASPASSPIPVSPHAVFPSDCSATLHTLPFACAQTDSPRLYLLKTLLTP